jgi:hypothetical protein
LSPERIAGDAGRDSKHRRAYPWPQSGTKPAEGNMMLQMVARAALGAARLSVVAN